MLKIARICQGLLLTFALAATIATGPSFAQTASGGLDKEVAVTRAKVTELRDTFVNATLAAALKCAIATPTLIIEDVPSFGQLRPGL